jgi:hypothetical protein
MFALLAAALTAAPPIAPAVEVQRIAAPEARQGVAAGPTHVYAIGNSQIAKYDRRTGRRTALWRGEAARYKHLNSCALVDRLLVCAASNYPEVPMASSVETFDPATLQPVHSRRLGRGRGSLTWLDWHAGSWWAGFANYDGRGGEPGRDHRWTVLVRFSRDFVEQGAWRFPPAVLARMAPHSTSGGAWGAVGLLYVTGHDRKEIYALRVPAAGSTLELVGNLPTVTGGLGGDRHAHLRLRTGMGHWSPSVSPPVKRPVEAVQVVGAQ